MTDQDTKTLALVKTAFRELSRHIERSRMRSTLTYDWDEYGEPHYRQLKKLLKL
jgi:hypothetical protein